MEKYWAVISGEDGEWLLRISYEGVVEYSPDYTKEKVRAILEQAFPCLLEMK